MTTYLIRYNGIFWDTLQRRIWWLTKKMHKRDPHYFSILNRVFFLHNCKIRMFSLIFGHFIFGENRVFQNTFFWRKLWTAHANFFFFWNIYQWSATSKKISQFWGAAICQKYLQSWLVKKTSFFWNTLEAGILKIFENGFHCWLEHAKAFQEW